MAVSPSTTRRSRAWKSDTEKFDENESVAEDGEKEHATEFGTVVPATGAGAAEAGAEARLSLPEALLLWATSGSARDFPEVPPFSASGTEQPSIFEEIEEPKCEEHDGQDGDVECKQMRAADFVKEDADNIQEAPVAGRASREAKLAALEKLRARR